MKTHIEAAGDYQFPKCGNFEPADEFALEHEVPSCIECRLFDTVQAKWEEYVAQPVLYGAESHTIRMAEHDAFFAGAFALAKELIPF